MSSDFARLDQKLKMDLAGYEMYAASGKSIHCFTISTWLAAVWVAGKTYPSESNRHN